MHQVNNIRDKYQNVIEVAKIQKQNGSILNPNRKTLGKREKKGEKQETFLKKTFESHPSVPSYFVGYFYEYLSFSSPIDTLNRIHSKITLHVVILNNL